MKSNEEDPSRWLIEGTTAIDNVCVLGAQNSVVLLSQEELG